MTPSNNGQERTDKAKKNILFGILIRGCSIAISLILVPLTIGYVDTEKYGIWLTLSSIIAWFSFFDIGLTQGFRNKFAEATSTNDDNSAQIYVSTTYAILGLIFFTVWIIFLIANPFISWTSILSLSDQIEPDVSILAVIIFTYFCLQFVFRTISTILTAKQQPAKSSLIDLLGQTLSLLIISILVKTTEGSLVRLGLALCIAPLVVLIGTHLYLFAGSLKKYRPLISKVDLSYSKGLFSLGIIFFVIQLAGIIQFETANVIIARNFGASAVTSYNIVYKYFGILGMGFAIFLSPFWSASTEAFMKNDITWIKDTVRKYLVIYVGLLGGGLVMLFFANYMYDLWLGKGTVKISYGLSLWGFVFFAVTMFASIFVNFLNGISALRIQFWSTLVSPFIYIASAIVLIRYFELGISSLFIAAIIGNFNGLILAPLQYYQVVHSSKRGIWIK